MKDSFRQAGALSEFYTQLQSIIHRCEDILIWQMGEDGKRVKLNAKIVAYRPDSHQTLITIASVQLNLLKKRLGIFIYDERQGILFKGKFLRNEGEDLVLRADENAYLRENRYSSRLCFQYTKVFVDLKYGDKIDFHDILLKDISEDGFGLLLPESMAKAFIVGMNLGITKLNSIILPRPLAGKIIHRTIMEKNDDPKKTKVKLGVKFHQKSNLIKLVMKVMNNEK